MYLQNLIEVIVGLVFTWFILSNATVQIQEWIAARLRWRANDLESAIERMLSDQNLTRLFYDHPIVRGLSGQDGARDTKPSYIPAKQFSTVLLSVILGASTESALLIHGLYGLPEKIRKIKSRNRRRQAQADLNQIFELARLAGGTGSGSAMDSLILVTLEKQINELGEHYPEMRESIQSLRERADTERQRIEALSQSLSSLEGQSGDVKGLLSGTLALSIINPRLKLALNSLLIGADKPGLKDDEFLQHLQSNIEVWFNDAMDRLSGWYKRRAQVVAFSIGILAALILNVDAIELSSHLWREPALREIITANASVLVQQGGGSPSESADPISAIQYLEEQYLALPLGWKLDTVKLLPNQTCSFRPQTGQVFGFRWNNGCHRPADAAASTNGWLWLVSKLTGLLMTGLACAQGSSFWFDVLMKVVNVRSAGIKPV